MVNEKFKNKTNSVKIEQKHINLGWYKWVNKSDIVKVLNEPLYRYIKNET